MQAPSMMKRNQVNFGQVSLQDFCADANYNTSYSGIFVSNIKFIKFVKQKYWSISLINWKHKKKCPSYSEIIR